MKAVRIIALLLTLCMFASVLLACNSSEEPTPSGTDAPTEKPTDGNNGDTPTNKPTTKPTARPTQPAYDEGELEEWIEIADYNGEDFDEYNVDIGQGSFMYVVKDTDPDEYDAYKESLEEQGFYLYTTHEIGENKFATYITETQIVHTMLVYYDYDENVSDYKGPNAQDHYEVRVMEDDRSVFDLAGLESQNVYEDKSSEYGFMTLLSDNQVTWPGRMGYIYQLADGSFFIIDGGYWDDTSAKSSATTLINVMKKYAPDPDNIVIAGWLFTHIHSDHIGAFYDISRKSELNSFKESLTIEKVIYNMPNSDEMLIQDSHDQYTGQLKNPEGVSAWEKKFNDALESMNPDAVIKAHTGQQFFLRDLTLTVYAAQDSILFSNISSGAKGQNLESIDWHNSTSVITSVEFRGKTTLFLGDSHKLAFVYYTVPVWRSHMNHEIVQVAHHGYGDTRANLLYQYLTPEMVIWPVCREHYNGQKVDGSTYYENGNAYGGVFPGSFNNALKGDDIVQIYPEKNICVTIDNFDTWEVYQWDAVPG